MSYKPFIYKLNNNHSFELNNNDIILTNRINQPKASLGFNTYFHRTINTFEKYKNNDELKEHIYYVVNNFESETKQEEDVFHQSKKILKVDEDEPDVLKQSFYALWEIIDYFDLCSKDKLTFAAISEGTGVSIQTIIKYREFNNINVSKDKYFTVSINENDSHGKKMSEQLLGYYHDKYPKLINVHKTKPSNKVSKLRSNGDITKLDTLSLFKKEVKNKYCDLVTAFGSFNTNIKTKEQLSYGLILGEIIAALKVQAKHGSFVLRVFETYTDVTLKMIYIMGQYYDDVFLVKPLFTRDTEQDKYIVFKNFKYDQEKNKKLIGNAIKNLETILKELSTDEYIFDILSDIELSNDFINEFKFINNELGNKQYNLINEIINYIKKQNYFGDDYHNYKNEQLEANKWWIQTFFNKKNNLQDLVNEIINYNKKEKELLLSNIN